MMCISKMLIFNVNSRVNKVSLNFPRLKCFIHTKTSDQLFTFHKHKFTESEQQQILNTLNQSNTEDLQRLKISHSKIKNLEAWKNKSGAFRSLLDILEIEDVNVKSAEKLCKNIINQNNGVPLKIKVKNKRQFITPLFVKEDHENLQSVIGLYLGPSAVSWAKLNLEGNIVQSWNYFEFTTRSKKTNPIETFELAVQLLNKLPYANVYVLEAKGNSSLQGQSQSQNTFSYNSYQLELLSMLIALINSSRKHNNLLKNTQGESIIYKNCVYFLRQKLSARLFNTLIGSERVSTITTISKVLDCSEDCLKLPITPVEVEKTLKDIYESVSPMYKDMLGQSLMLAITFTDICIYNNPNSLNVISNKKKLCI